MPQTVEEIAYEASSRAIDRQYDALGALRAKSATILAAAALVASFIGPEALRANGGSLSGWVGVGILALVAVMLLVLAILWPRKLVFSLSARVILDAHSTSAVPDLLALLARRQDDHLKANEQILEQLRRCSRLASVAIVIETVALLLAI
ncbi:MAG: hypothetical protein ACTHKT_08415 [Solirubrobacterales bacterium]